MMRRVAMAVWFLAALALLCLPLLLVLGCGGGPQLIKPKLLGAGGGPSAGGFRILDLLASACAIAAVASVVFATWLRVAPRTTITLVFCAVGCWTLRALLNDYLWIIEVLAVVGLGLFGFVSFHSILAWLERYFGIDFNRDGTIGPRPKPLPDGAPDPRPGVAGAATP